MTMNPPINPDELLDTETVEDEGPTGVVYSVTDQIIREKIVYILKTYPMLSYSMVQVGIGASLEPRMWHPVLAKMIRLREVTEEAVSNVTPNGRSVSSKRLYLTGFLEALRPFMTISK